MNPLFSPSDLPNAKLSSVEKTALVTLACRAAAHCSPKFPSFLDSGAFELAQDLKISLRRYGSNPSTRKAVVARTEWFKKQLFQAFELSAASDFSTAVLNLGSGFDTMAGAFLGTVHGEICWQDADLPAINSVKERLRPFCNWSSAVYSIVDVDLLHPTNLGRIARFDNHRPAHLVVLLQGVLMYLAPQSVGNLLHKITDLAHDFSMTTIIFDWCSPFLKYFSRLHPGLLRAGLLKTPFRWSLQQMEDATRALPGFQEFVTEDPVYFNTNVGTRSLQWFHDRLLKPNSAGIYGCTVLRRDNNR